MHAPALFAPNNKKNNVNNDNVDNKFLCDSNILISKDKNFSNTSYKNLKRKIGSMDTFKELTIKGTSATTSDFGREDINYI